MDARSLTEAVSAWTGALGGAHVILDQTALDDAATATFATRSKVEVILQPGSVEDVQAAVRIANRHRIPLYPISTGKNWGYGSRVPVVDGVLVDLGRLNRIVDYNEDLAYVTIEPGVTQRQLFAFLQDHGSRLWMDATGASPDCSVIGNTLERGFGHTPMGDHCANVCGLQVVLPTGESIDTGFGRFDSAKSGALSRWGVGPSLDGLFSQSNFGIVTRMTVWLMPAPEHFEAFFFMSGREDGLSGIVDALRPLRLNGTLRSLVHVANDYKVLAAARQFPWDDPGIPVPIDRAAMARLRGKLAIGCWNGSGGLYGTRRQVADARRQLRRALRGKVDRLQFVDDRLLKWMGRFATPFRAVTGWNVTETIKVIEPVYNLLKGVPTDATLASAYWRKKIPVPARPDPDRDGCGLLWCSPVVPNLGSALREVADLATDVVLAHGFEPQMSVSLANERYSISVITISYDREATGEDARALECYRALTADLLARGYPPYRLNVASMSSVRGDDAYGALLASLKEAFDPGGILAPGRYQPAAAAGPARRDLRPVDVPDSPGIMVRRAAR